MKLASDVANEDREFRGGRHVTAKVIHVYALPSGITTITLDVLSGQWLVAGHEEIRRGAGWGKPSFLQKARTRPSRAQVRNP